ncbi:MAG: aspartate-semialdehyde dehydrogenase, partial [Candidatus Delongbacteria bacterium]|nr:aspartate-semialdehyde dehydrogenase [Candidatus Delongbacteria bacterium]
MGRKKYNIAVAGATGAVGRKLLEVLEKRNFPVSEIKLLASKRSAGEIISFGGKEHTVEVMKEDSFDGVDIALFSAGSSVSSAYAPIAVRSGAVVIDNSSCFRNDPS